MGTIFPTLLYPVKCEVCDCLLRARLLVGGALINTTVSKKKVSVYVTFY
jgi:hypothetical protein